MRRRITLAIMLGMSIILLSFGIASYYIVQENIKELHSKKLTLARVIRNNIDITIKNNINRLYDISLSGSIDFNDRDSRPEREALKAAYRYSIYTDGVFLLDSQGNVILTYPERARGITNVMSVEPIRKMISLGRPVVSNVYTIEPTKRKVMYILVPLKDKNGNDAGVAGGEIDPTNPMLNHILRLIEIGKNTFVDIVDSNGVIIASSTPSRTLTSCDRNSFFTTVIAEKKERIAPCHHCHDSGNERRVSKTILAFVPLEMAPWGITIQEPESDILAPAVKLKKLFGILGVIFVGTALVLTIGISRSIVDPIKELTRVTGRIADGEMAEPVSFVGSDEIGALSRSFETMRVKLVESLEKLRKYNIELEQRVEERTRQIHESQQRVTNLLKKVITSQEEERKRIARGLHDETIQDLSATLMRIDMCRLYPEKVTSQKVGEIRNIVLRAWDGLVNIIQNLRPTLLDDLGMEAAIKRLLDMHLGEKGVRCFLRITGYDDGGISPEVKITLFRIIQEAITNIARHANAENVFVIMKANNDIIKVDIEDDGDGFDVHALFRQAHSDLKDSRGLGLIGMKERASQIGGTLRIYSSPGCGAGISIRVPLKTIGAEHV